MAAVVCVKAPPLAFSSKVSPLLVVTPPEKVKVPAVDNKTSVEVAPLKLKARLSVSVVESEIVAVAAPEPKVMAELALPKLEVAPVAKAVTTAVPASTVVVPV